MEYRLLWFVSTCNNDFEASSISLMSLWANIKFFPEPTGELYGWLLANSCSYICHTALSRYSMFVTQVYHDTQCLSHSSITILNVCHTALSWYSMFVTQLYHDTQCLSHSSVMILNVCHTALSRYSMFLTQLYHDTQCFSHSSIMILNVCHTALSQYLFIFKQLHHDYS